MLRFVVRLAAGTVLVAAALVAVVYGLLRSGVLDSSMGTIITTLARDEGVFFVRAEDVSGDLPDRVKARRVEIGDGDGVWMTIEDVDIAWHPFDLFHPFDDVKWRIHADDARARRIEWTRLPHDTPDDPDEEPFRWDRFIRIVVGHIVVEDFELCGELLGGATERVRAEGSGVLGEWDHGFVKLDIEHIDHRSGKARIDLRTGGEPLELSGSIVAEELEGGALAELARLPDAGTVTLDAKAWGRMQDWHAEAKVTASAIGKLATEVSLSFNEHGPFHAKGTFDPVPAIRDAALIGPGAPVAFEADGAWAPDVEVRLDRVRVAADGRELGVDGRLDLATLDWKAAARLAHEKAGEPVALTLLSTRNARLDASGRLGDEGTLDATLAADSVVAGALEAGLVEARLQAKDAAGDGDATFSLQGAVRALASGGARVPLAGQDVRVAAAGRVNLDLGRVAADDVRVDGEAVRVRGPLTIADGWSTLKTNLTVDASSLETLTAAFATSVRGEATASADVAWDLRGGDGTVKLVASGKGVSVGERGWHTLVGEAPRAELDWEGSPDGPARARVVLATEGIAGEATASMGSGGRDLVADARLALDNLARLAEPTQAAIAGRLDVTASARGSLARFDARVDARGDRFSYEGVRFDRAEVGIDARGLPDAWSASVGATGSYGKQDAALDVDVAMPAADRVEVRGLSLRGPRTSGAADLVVDLAAGTAAGSVELRAEDLSLWRSMTGLALGGRVVADLDLAAANGAKGGAAQVVSGRVEVRNGSIEVGASELFVDSADVVADGARLGAEPAGHVSVDASRVRYGTTTLVTGRAAASGDGRRWNVETVLEARDGITTKLDAAGSVQPGPPLEVALARAAGQLGDTALRLEQEARFTAEPARSTWTLAPTSIAVGTAGRVRATASSTSSRLAVDAEATALPLELVGAFVPDIDLLGNVDAKAKLEGASLASATGTVSLRGHGIASAEMAAGRVPPVDVEADGDLRGGRLRGKASVVGLSQSRLDATFDAPIVLAAAPAPVAATLQWKGEVAEVLSLLPMAGDQLRGRIDTDLRVGGTTTSPRVTGSLLLDGGTWENATTGLVLRDLRIDMAGDGAGVELRSLTATDGEKGRVVARGRARSPSGLPAFELELDAEASDAMLARLDLVTARADAKVEVRASRGSAPTDAVTGSIRGDVRIDEARLKIPQGFVAEIPEIDVIEVGTGPQDPRDTVAHAGPAALDLDVAVTADNRIFLSGRGLESEWASDLHVRGTTAAPLVDGTVRSVRGQLSLLGKRFDVDSATIRFDGAADNIPWVQLRAKAETRDITAIAEVSGRALKPDVTLTSDPPLPRDEVLARVLFGQSAATLTPMQSVQLATSIAELTGAPLLGGGGGLVTGIGRTLGLDSLGFGSSGADGAAALTASKYLTDDVYLRVQQGLTPEDSKLSIEWRVWKNITVESDVSQDAQGGVGATWRWDY